MLWLDLTDVSGLGISVNMGTVSRFYEVRMDGTKFDWTELGVVGSQEVFRVKETREEIKKKIWEVS